MADSDVKKGFSITMGVVLALFFIFIVLPTATCVGCMTLGVGAAGVTEGARQAEVQQKGPEISISDIKFKINDANPYLHKTSYSFVVKNHRDRPLSKSFDVKFQDVDGLTVDEELVIGQRIPAGGEVTIDGTTTMLPAESPSVESMLVVER